METERADMENPKDGADVVQSNAASAGSPPLQSAAERLKALTAELEKLEQRKLPEVKRELEAFVKKQKDAVEEYKKAYGPARDAWRAMQGRLTRAKALIDQSFPAGAWEKIIADCICVQRRRVACLEQTIKEQRQCSQGKKERDLWEAQRAFQAAKTRQEILSSNAAQVTAALAANDAKLTAVESALSKGPERALILQSFFFDILPVHVALAPPDCETFKSDVAPDALCKAANAAPCPDVGAPCKPAAAAAPAVAGAAAPAAPRRSAPWLMPVNAYEHELDVAWDAYQQAKDLLTVAEAQFKAEPDDLASREKRLPDERKRVDEEIKKCLTGKTPADPCGTPSTATASQE